MIDYFPNFEKLLQHKSTTVKIELLRNLYFYRSKTFISEVEEFIDSADQELRIEAFNYLFEHVVDDNITYINKYLHHENYKISDTALLGAAQETRDNPELKVTLGLEEIIDKKLKEAVDSGDSERIVNTKIICAKAIGISTLKTKYDYLGTLLRDENINVKRAAVFGCGRTLEADFVPYLINMLSNNDLSPQIKEALGFYGSSIITTIDKYIVRNDIDISIKRQLPAVLENLHDQRAVDKLFEYTDSVDLTIRKEALRSLNHIRKKYPHLKFNRKGIERKILNEAKLYIDTLAVLYSQISADTEVINDTTIIDGEREARKNLIELLEKQLDSSLERIFRLLGLKYPPDDMLEMFKGIQSNQPDLRINSIEYLDNLLGPNLKKVIIPIAEAALLSLLSEEKIEELNLKSHSEFECFEMILKGADLKLIQATLHLIMHTKDVKYLKLIDEFSEHPNDKIRSIARVVKSELTEN